MNLDNNLDMVLDDNNVYDQITQYYAWFTVSNIHNSKAMANVHETK